MSAGEGEGGLLFVLYVLLELSEGMVKTRRAKAREQLL
jgi:hypothetical protein